jgi:hypothetical protein
MKYIIETSFSLMICLISGILSIVVGYCNDGVLYLVIGCINMFFTGIFSMVLLIEIVLYRFKKKGEIE